MGTYLGDTVYFEATLTDKDGSALTPDSLAAYLYDPSGTKKDEDTSPSLVETGKYEAVLTIPSNGTAGVWKTVWYVKKGDEEKREELLFFVDEIP